METPYQKFDLHVHQKSGLTEIPFRKIDQAGEVKQLSENWQTRVGNGNATLQTVFILTVAKWKTTGCQNELLAVALRRSEGQSCECRRHNDADPNGNMAVQPPVG